MRRLLSLELAAMIVGAVLSVGTVRVHAFMQTTVDHFPASQIANCLIVWNQTVGANDTDVLATVQAYIYKATVDGVGVQLSATCSGTAAPYSCNSPVPTQGQGVGPHQLTLTANDLRGQQSTPSQTYAYVVDALIGPPGQPTNVAIKARSGGGEPAQPTDVHITLGTK